MNDRLRFWLILLGIISCVSATVIVVSLLYYFSPASPPKPLERACNKCGIYIGRCVRCNIHEKESCAHKSEWCDPNNEKHIFIAHPDSTCLSISLCK